MQINENPLNPLNLRIVLTEGLCLDCKAPFTGEMITGYPGLKQLRCDPCVEAWRKRRAIDLDSKSPRRSNMDKGGWNTVCPPLYLDTDLGKLPEKNQAAARKIWQWPVCPRGIVLVGQSAGGKTRTLVKLFERLWYEGSTIRMFFGQQFGHECAKQFGARNGENWMQELVTVDILLLDDIGKLVLTDRTERELFGLIDERIMYKRPVFATTNSGGEELKAGLRNDIGGALVSRLRRFCECMAF